MQTAYIGLGANLPSKAGTPESTLDAAVGRLSSVGRILCRSSLYRTEPVGLAEQPHFLNAVVALETELEPCAALEELLRIEKEYGRDRAAGIPNGPRTLDLDILLWGALQVHEPQLEIPHPRLAERAFALVPLNEIAPLIVVPNLGKTVAQLLHSLLQNRETDAHAVLPFQSDLWRAGSCPGDGGAAATERSGASHDHD